MINNKIFRYIFSGSTAAVVNISVLYILTDILKFWYVISSIIAFGVSIFVSFFMQKHFTFEDSSYNKTSQQFAYYVLISTINLLLNTILIYLLVDFIGIYYLYSQIISSGFIAVESFFVYNFVIFKKTEQKC